MIERRRAERVQVSEHVIGRVQEVGDARVIDISLTGVLVEIGASMGPDATCNFTMPLNGEDEIHVEAQVRRCEPSRYMDDGLGNKSFLYRAGLEFIEVSATTHSRLGQFLAEIKRRSARPDTARIAQLARDS